MVFKKATNQDILNALSAHDNWEHERDDKLNGVYKVLITGNGVPSLLERVRNLETSSKIVSGIIAAVGMALIGAMFTGHISVVIH